MTTAIWLSIMTFALGLALWITTSKLRPLVLREFDRTYPIRTAPGGLSHRSGLPAPGAWSTGKTNAMTNFIIIGSVLGGALTALAPSAWLGFALTAWLA